MPLLDPTENVALIEAASRLAVNATDDNEHSGIDDATRESARTFLRRMFDCSTSDPHPPPAGWSRHGDDDDERYHSDAGQGDDGQQ